MPDCRTAGARSLFGPLRLICRIDKVPLGEGHKQVLTLQCGHQVEHLQRNDLKVGKRTGCPECR